VTMAVVTTVGSVTPVAASKPTTANNPTNCKVALYFTSLKNYSFKADPP